MNFLYKRKNTLSHIDDIELADFTRKKILSGDASSSVEKPLKVNHHVAMVLNSDPALQDVAKVCVVVGVPIGMKRFSGSMSNSVWKVDLDNNQSVILRIYASDSGILVDRDAEMKHFVTLSELNIGPKCLATFLNGRIEEFLAASSLTCQSIQEESLAIAETMAKFHSTTCIQSDIVLWKYLDKWYQAVLIILMNNSTLHNQLKTSIDIYTLGKDIKRLKSLIDFKSIVFSHNDLQYGNIMKLKDSDRITFIDFEYSGYNYLEYDIANYFCEWMADYDSVKPHFLDKSKYPSQEQQEAFIMYYLKTKYPKQSHGHLLIKAQVIIKRIPLFTSCSHLLWGLWGIIYGSNVKKDGDFDYISYATNRLKMFAEIKGCIPVMGKVYRKHLTADILYTCSNCSTHLISAGDIVSKSYMSKAGRAYLASSLVNISVGQAVNKTLSSGNFDIADVFCNGCDCVLGWKYIFAYSDSQKYKEDMYIVDKVNLFKNISKAQLATM